MKKNQQLEKERERERREILTKRQKKGERESQREFLMKKALQFIYLFRI